MLLEQFTQLQLLQNSPLAKQSQYLSQSILIYEWIKRAPLLGLYWYYTSKIVSGHSIYSWLHFQVWHVDKLSKELQNHWIISFKSRSSVKIALQSQNNSLKSQVKISDQLMSRLNSTHIKRKCYATNYCTSSILKYHVPIFSCKCSTYSLRHCDLVQLQGLRGLLGGEDSGELL